MIPAFAKKPLVIIWAAAIVSALIVGWFLYSGYHKKPAPKSLPVAQAPATSTSSTASAPTPESAKADKPSPFGPPVVEPTTKADKPKAKSSPSSKVSASKTGKPKASPPVVVKRQVAVTRQQLEDFKELLQKLVGQGITVHLIDETPRAEAEETAEAEERSLSDKEREEAFKEAIRKGRLP